MERNANMKVFQQRDQLAELRSQIYHLNRTRNEQQKLLLELSEAKEKLERTIQENQDFVSIAGHELKTPLMILQLRLESRRRKLATGQYCNINNEQLEQMLDSDHNQLNLLASHVEDLLTISKLRSEKFVLKLGPVNICSLVRHIVDKNQELATRANVEFEIHSPEAIWGKWDKFRMEQVITNLLTNAIRYGAGRPVKIHLHLEDAKAFIIFEDQGIGIAKENIEKIFDKYVRLDESGPEGLGLGLYIVNQIIKAHKGVITVQSQKGVGSTFRVELPIN
jgi:signal transduction histidine kinase